MLENYSSELIDKAKKIKILVLDVDGVLTGGELIYGNSGNQLKIFNVNDGFGIFLIKSTGIKCVILTAKASNTVMNRAKELKIDKVYQNFHYKIKAYKKIQKKFKVTNEEVCFMGDEIIDIPVLKRVGLAACPPGAVEEAKSFAHLITKNAGGRGAVREVCDLILKAQGTWDQATARYFE